jgi:hypothetical protein
MGNCFQGEIVIDSSNKWIDIYYDPYGTPVMHSKSIAEGTYNSAKSVVFAIQTELITIDSNFRCKIEADGKVTIYHLTSMEFWIMWETGPHGRDNADDNISEPIGFWDIQNDLFDHTYTSDYQHMNGFYFPVGPSFDSRDRAQTLGPSTFVALSSKALRATWGTHWQRQIDLAFIPRDQFFEAFAYYNDSFEEWWIFASKGNPFIYFLNAESWPPTDDGLYVLLVDDNPGLLELAERLGPGAEYYSVSLRMIRQDF